MAWNLHSAPFQVFCGTRALSLLDECPTHRGSYHAAWSGQSWYPPCWSPRASLAVRVRPSDPRPRHSAVRGPWWPRSRRASRTRRSTVSPRPASLGCAVRSKPGSRDGERKRGTHLGTATPRARTFTRTASDGSVLRSRTMLTKCSSAAGKVSGYRATRLSQHIDAAPGGRCGGRGHVRCPLPPSRSLVVRWPIHLPSVTQATRREVRAQRASGEGTGQAERVGFEPTRAVRPRRF
jgi:hypothetical protein